MLICHWRPGAVPRLHARYPSHYMSFCHNIDHFNDKSHKLHSKVVLVWALHIIFQIAAIFLACHTHPLVLVRRHRRERCLREYKCAKVAGVFLLIQGIIFGRQVDDVKPRLVPMHRVEDYLKIATNIRFHWVLGNASSSSYMAIFVQLVIGKFEFVERDDLLHPRRAWSWRVRVDMYTWRRNRIRFSCNNPTRTNWKMR